MNDPARETGNALDRADEDAVTLSDEALEKAAAGTNWAPMLTGVATICGGEKIVAVRRSHSFSKQTNKEK